MTGPIYLDYQATTPLAPQVFDVMTPWLRDKFGNPHSAHRLGREAAAAIAVARDQVSTLLPSGGQFVFTGSATEAINQAFGAAKLVKGLRLLVAQTEHAAILDTAAAYAAEGYKYFDLPVDAEGLLDLDILAEELGRGDIALVAVMLVNNEIGTIQRIDEIADMVHAAGGLLLCDCVQGYGRVPLPEKADLIAISAHKFHGPKGIGGLWIRDGVDVPEFIHGGGQEGGMRSGTLSPALCVGMGEAARLMAERFEEDRAHVEALANFARFEFGQWTINGSATHRYPGNLNIRRDGVDVGRLMSEVRDVAFSAGSACASGSGRTSHVLKAVSLNSAQAKSSIRLGFGRYTSEDDIIRAATMINEAAERQI